jgi:hypothetical protein
MRSIRKNGMKRLSASARRSRTIRISSFRMIITAVRIVVPPDETGENRKDAEGAKDAKRDAIENA